MTPTPAHQAFREKRAEIDLRANYAAADRCCDSCGQSARSDTSRVAFQRGHIAGMAAEFEVARLMGRIELLREIEEGNGRDWKASRMLAEAQLAALLAKVGG